MVAWLRKCQAWLRFTIEQTYVKRFVLSVMEANKELLEVLTRIAVALEENKKENEVIAKALCAIETIHLESIK